jgi:hypothetical protein
MAMRCVVPDVGNWDMTDFLEAFRIVLITVASNSVLRVGGRVLEFIKAITCRVAVPSFGDVRLHRKIMNGQQP